MAERVYTEADRGEGMTKREIAGRTLAANRGREIERVGEHRFLVPSRTEEGRMYTVDLGVESCTCPDRQYGGNTCAHMFAAAAVMMELDSEPEYTIEKAHDSRRGGYVFRLVEYRGGERVGLASADLDSWYEAWMFREDLYRTVGGEAA